jgi:surface antigen
MMRVRAQEDAMNRLTLVLALSAVGLSLSAPASGAVLSSLYGCDAQGTNNTTGAVVGGLIGALAGSQVSRHERGLGAVVGAGVGAAIGNSVGCRMDRKARQDAQAAFQRALDTGRTQTWSDAESGSSGRIEVLGPAGPVRRPAPGGRWRFADGVAPAIRVSSVGGAYAATGRINMRAAPNASAEVVDRLQAGERIEVAGAVAGGWLAVIEDGYIQGYVARSVVRPVGGGGGYGGGECQLVLHTLTEPGQPTVRERYNACRDDAGAWNLTAA